MKAVIEKSRASGSVTAPPSKSVLHRMLICAALSKEESVIKNAYYSEDILATLDCLEKMGARVERGVSSVKIGGLDPLNIPEDVVLPCRESGSTLRFLVPLALLGGKRVTFEGSEKLFSRPLGVYEELSQNGGFLFEKGAGRLTVCGKLSAGEYPVPGNVSSQFITGLLFALPFCGESKIRLTTEIQSKSYVDITLSVMKKFGVSATWQNAGTLYLSSGQTFKAHDCTAEGDCSSAAFLDAFNFFGGSVSVSGLDAETLQGDRVYKEHFELLEKGMPVLDIADCPDLAPILMTVAAFKNGARFKNTARLRMKESDRGEAMKKELSAFGAKIDVFENEIVVQKTPLHSPERTLSSHNDHRVAMSLAVLSSVFGGEIEGAEAVSKSFPTFFEVIKNLGIRVDLI
ncbi:MAG: 3-phosphoshikimate 1-carboxyvinyltransferase [Clostridia bacterium]|nr:3-phosphoshikimate 1-carboxyvinyltransferase [Clostridia bacterium]